MDELIDQDPTFGSAPSSRERTRVMPRWREIARESWRNLVGGTTHVVRWSVILLALVGSLAWLEVSAVRVLVDDTASYITDGGATWILQAPQAINGNTCDSLSGADGVLAAGALRGESVGLVTTVLPKAPIPLYSVTPGFPNLIGASSLTGVVVADQVVDRYALVTPTTIDTTIGPVAISGGYAMPSDSRSSIGFAALQPTYSDQVFDECWITIWPTNDSVKMLAYTALIPSDNPQQMGVKLSQLNPTFASGVDPAKQYDNRLTRWAPVAALVGGLVIGFAAIWTRRLELASTLHAGLHGDLGVWHQPYWVYQWWQSPPTQAWPTPPTSPNSGFTSSSLAAWPPYWAPWPQD